MNAANERFPGIDMTRIHERLISAGMLTREQVEWEKAERARQAAAPLIAAEPAHLGDELLHVGDPRSRGAVQHHTGGHRPVGDQVKGVKHRRHRIPLSRR